MTSAAGVAILLPLLLAQVPPSINIGLRDGTVMDDVPVLRGRLPRAVLRILGVRLGVDTLASVRERLGPAPLLDDSQNPHDPLSVCYVVASADTKIFFESLDIEEDPGEQGIAWSFTLARSSDRDGRCPRVASAAQLQTESGMRLDMTPAEVRKQLGPPSLATDALILYVFRSPDWIGVVEVHLDHGKAKRITAGEWKDS
jgi:hypothetical protein